MLFRPNERFCYNASMEEAIILPQQLDYMYKAPIGVDIKGSIWPCVEMPNSAAFFGTRKSVRCDIEIDGVALLSVGFMVTGTGGHMISISQKLRRQLNKDIGDEVTVLLVRRVK
jgi:hypothetical protein